MDAVIENVLPLLIIAAIAGLVGLWIARSTELGLSIFRPYWGRDPWPRGVQEDDDVRFDWSRGPSAAAAEPEPERAPVEPARHVDVHRRR